MHRDKIMTGYYRQTFTITRTHWKALNTVDKRCDEDTKMEANTTKCITHYIEEKTGCSMGFAGSDPKVNMQVI